MNRKRPLHLKPIDQDQRTFYWFELDATTHALYDSDMGEPIVYGSLKQIGTVLAMLNKDIEEGKRKPCALWFFKRTGIAESLTERNAGAFWEKEWTKRIPKLCPHWSPEKLIRNVIKKPDTL